MHTRTLRKSLSLRVADPLTRELSRPAMANAVFSCPKCGQIVGDIPHQGLLTAVCGDCRLRYQVVRGRVTAAEATVSVIRSATVHWAAVSEWAYLIRLSLAGGRTELIEFRLTEPETFA